MDDKKQYSYEPISNLYISKSPKMLHNTATNVMATINNNMGDTNNINKATGILYKYLNRLMYQVSSLLNDIHFIKSIKPLANDALISSPIEGSFWESKVLIIKFNKATSYKNKI